MLPARATAQISGSVSLQSDYRLRGYSLTEGEPTAIVSLSYDDSSGFYLNGSAFRALAHYDNPAMYGFTANAGYARRISPGLSIDGGVLDSEYRHRYGYGASTHYTEFYAGLLTSHLASHVYYSPNYFRAGTSTLYAEFEGTVSTVGELRFNAHVGRLTYIDQRSNQAQRADQYDWRLTASRRFRMFDFYLALTGGGPGKDYYDGNPHSKTALLGGVTWTF